MAEWSKIYPRGEYEMREVSESERVQTPNGVISASEGSFVVRSRQNEDDSWSESVYDPDDYHNRFTDSHTDTAVPEDVDEDVEEESAEEFDPNEHNISEVKYYVENNDLTAEEIQSIYDLEENGKNRPTLTDWLTNYV